MTKQDISKLSILYLVQGIVLTIIATIGTLLVERFTSVGDLRVSVMFSCGFSLAIVLAEGNIWRMVATKHPDSLTTFFTTLSGFRMLLALATMFVYYLIAGREAMLPFFLVFMAFYVLLLIHHSIFFAKVSNRS
ncbi:hypothetical protein [Prevotella sp. E2-28]|uniref:hypothetical protein n=1 Tax=Prevotella sp. E2-28 TaxID=2913620 RepID=UPI001EDA7FE8|nr:hypothetical protein [Prevotella sp. E2-28]UKK52467.1 hypothetical protein L6465_07525 [Prevotella sp. E2-28]